MIFERIGWEGNECEEGKRYNRRKRFERAKINNERKRKGGKEE